MDPEREASSAKNGRKYNVQGGQSGQSLMYPKEVRGGWNHPFHLQTFGLNWPPSISSRSPLQLS